MIVVAMGVCGSGKTTVGRLIAERLDWVFIEGDDLHPEANRRKMAAGTPLTDEDPLAVARPDRGRDAARRGRRPLSGGGLLGAASGLSRPAAPGRADVRFLHLTGAPALLRVRMERRDGHFMPAGLLASQLATLEPAGPGETLHDLDVSRGVETLVRTALELLAT